MVLGPSLPVVIGVITFFAWAGIARVVRGQTLSIKEKEYIEAARSVGAGPWRVMFIDIMPNLLGPVLVLATLSIPAAIIFEATLSFLGLGVQPPTASWGNLLAGAQNYYSVAWWYLVFPALALLITTLAFNLLGDGIRDALDPRTERVLRGPAPAPARPQAIRRRGHTGRRGRAGRGVRSDGGDGPAARSRRSRRRCRSRAAAPPSARALPRRRREPRADAAGRRRPEPALEGPRMIADDGRPPPSR